jgi:valyl-tRNA synthetase
MKVASEALVQIRKSKSDAKLSMKAEIKTATLSGAQELSLIAEDLKSVGKIAELKLLIGNELALSDLEFASEE